MTKIVGINHLKAVAALQKVGFEIRRQSGHVIMTDGVRIVAIPRHNPVNAFTMGDIVKAVGLTPDQFRKLL
jgi:predicted RNA binding protein YcfA (HicA-like mRNA interferase family)